MGTSVDIKFWMLIFLLIGVWNNYVTKGEGFPPLDFFDEPKEGTPLQERFTKTFLCRASSHPPAEFRWLKDGVFISNFSSTLYSIRIENIQRNDSGVYRCIARNEFGSILSSGAKLEVAYMDEFEHKGQTVHEVIYQGDAHVIPLPHISSFPFPTIAWYENFAPMSEELFRSHVTLNKSLVLLDRGIQDSRKTYQPEALNGFTFDQAEKGPIINVTVLASSGGDRSTPAIVIPPVDKIVIRDKDVQAVFECVVNGSPLTDMQIIWYKVESQGPIPIIPSQDKYLISFTNRTLTIKTPEPSDAGEYQCEAQLNGAGNSIRARASLTVYVSPTFSSLWTSDYNQDFGDTISIPCQGQGIPAPTIKWYHNAQELTSSNDPRYTIHSNGNLTISQLDLDHAGVYQCFIRNEAGETWLSTWLRVNSAPEFIRRPADITVIEGDEAKFQCLTQGAPKPVVVWSKDTGSRYEEIMPGGRILLINGHELLITTTESTDSGLYQCNASNSQGFVNDLARLTVFVQTQIIRPPQNLTVIKSTVAVFTCGVSHDPNIVVTWTWSYQAMNQDQKQVVVPDGYKKIIESDGTLKINQINNNDIGNYMCDVISTGGNDSRTVTLQVIGMLLL